MAHLLQHIQALIVGMNQGAGGAIVGGGHVRPIGKHAPVFPRKIEEGGQHHSRQFGGDLINPVEGFAARQGIQYIPCALADRFLHIAQILGRHNGGNSPALTGMSRRVHADKASHVPPVWIVS